MDLHKAIRAIHSNAVTINGNNQNDITAIDTNGNEVTINWTQVNAWTDPEQYKMDRANEYPALAEQFDKLWHDINNGTLDNTGEFFTAINTVKTNNPKPSE
tara:strand:+ start:246 stop:548 length:303 start_codon:yes stop_codon:yes gene_type:complete